MQANQLHTANDAKQRYRSTLWRACCTYLLVVSIGVTFVCMLWPDTHTDTQTHHTHRQHTTIDNDNEHIHAFEHSLPWHAAPSYLSVTVNPTLSADVLSVP